MRKVLKFVLFIVFALIAVVIITPFFIPKDEIKRLVSEKVKEMTGRDLVIAGDVSAHVFPDISVSLNQVSLSNPEGFSDKQMAEIAELKAEVELMPLLHKQVVIKQISVVKPVIHLEKNKSGTPNWQISVIDKTGAGKAGGEEGKPAESTSKKQGVVAFPVLGNTKIKDGEFTYKDQKTGKSYSAQNVDLDIKASSLDKPVNAVASLLWNGEKVSVDLNADEPNKLVSGSDSLLKLDAKIGNIASLAFAGKASMQSASGDIDFSTSSIASLAALSGKKEGKKAAGGKSLSVKSAVACSTSECAFSKAIINFDGSEFAGNVKAGFAGEIPSITADITTETLDLNKLLSKDEKQALLIPIEAILIPEAVAAEGWSTKKIDLSDLKAANANISLNAKNVIYNATKLINLAMNAKLSGGSLAVDIPSVSLYGGNAKISATANTANAISANIAADKIQLEPLLKDFVNFDRLSGTAKINTSVSGRGASQQEIVSSLSGRGSLNIANGEMRGVDISKIVSQAKSLAGAAAGTSGTTNFSDLSGTYTISGGVVSNNDLVVKSPMLNVKGAGTVSLPAQHVNYRLNSSLMRSSGAQPQTASQTTQDGATTTAPAEKKIGFEVPIIVEGNFDSLRFYPDVAAIAQEALRDPEKMKKQLKNVKETIKDIKGAIKGKDNLGNILNNLGGFGGQQEPAPAPANPSAGK